MTRRKKVIRLTVLFMATALIIVVGIVIFQYYEFNNVAKAVGGMPWQDGGTITMVKPVCILDTPMPYPTTCEISCPLVTSVYGTACIAYMEINTKGQKGTTFMAVTKGFVFSGGGAFPTAGMDFIAGGSSNSMPWIIGIPGLAVNNIDKVKNWFNKYIIAGFKKSEK